MEEINISSRATLLTDYFKLLSEQEQLSAAYDELGDDQSGPETEALSDEKAEELSLQAEKLYEKLEENTRLIASFRDEYIQLLEQKPLSRCPFSGNLLVRSIDLSGIDGLFWDYEYPARKNEELLPTFFAMDGALKLSEPIENVPFTCQVGPEIPFVLPRLLQYESIKAVLSSFELGTHKLFVITYYSDPLLTDIRRVNDIGSYNYSYTDQTGLTQFDFYEDPDKDFELEDWIKAGRLLWINPGDREMALKGFLAGCPYLNLDGNRETLAVSKGARTVKEPLAWVVETGDYLPNEEDFIPIDLVASAFAEEDSIEVYEEADLNEIEAALSEDPLFNEDQTSVTGEEESV